MGRQDKEDKEGLISGESDEKQESSPSMVAFSVGFYMITSIGT